MRKGVSPFQLIHHRNIYFGPAAAGPVPTPMSWVVSDSHKTRITSVVTSVTCISEKISSDEALAIEESNEVFTVLPTDRATKISPRTTFSVASVAI